MIRSQRVLLPVAIESLPFGFGLVEKVELVHSARHRFFFSLESFNFSSIHTQMDSHVYPQYGPVFLKSEILVWPIWHSISMAHSSEASRAEWDFMGKLTPESPTFHGKTMVSTLNNFKLQCGRSQLVTHRCWTSRCARGFKQCSKSVRIRRLRPMGFSWFLQK